jgi:molybdate transport system ATP-binding protein
MIDIDIEQRLGTFQLAVKFLGAPIVGLSLGFGKTSVVNAIAASQAAARDCINDAVLFDPEGIDYRRRPPRRLCVQDALLFPHWTWNQSASANGRAGCFIDERRVVELLGLSAAAAPEAKTLSGGKATRRHRRALLAQPRILLMDEPLAALDIPRKTESRLRRTPARRARHPDRLCQPLRHGDRQVADTVVVLSRKVPCRRRSRRSDGPVDLRPATGRYEAGSILTLRRGMTQRQLTTLAFDGGELIVPHLDEPIGERCAREPGA